MSKSETARDRFVGEPIKPRPGTFDTRAMARGEPGLPGRFTWRGTEYEIEAILKTWRETGPCRSGSPEQYVRKHGYRVRTTSGDEMTLYFERQARSRRQAKARWWLLAIAPNIA